MHTCPKCNSKASTGASDCQKCGHQFTPGIDSPEVHPWQVAEPVFLFFIAAKLTGLTVKAFQTGHLGIPFTQGLQRTSEQGAESLLWWAAVGILSILAIGCVCKAVIITAKYFFAYRLNRS